MYVYKKLVNVVRTTVRGTKAVALVIANTLEKAQMRKLSNAAEKGDRIFFWYIKKIFSRRLGFGKQLASAFVYSIQF